MEKARRTRMLRTNATAWLLLLPTLLFLGLFTLLPVLQTVYYSFHHLNLGIPKPMFAGLDNYRSLLTDEVFRKVMRNTLIFAGVTVPFSMALALAIALFVNGRMRGNSVLRTLYFYPTVIPAIAVANIWLFIYTPEYGLLGRLLHWLGMAQVNWLGTQETVLGATIVMAIWKEAGFLMVFYLAGLQNISRDLYEAAAIDGGGPWYVFRRITFPLLMPTSLFVLIVATTGTFKLVDHLVVMTKGGPDNGSNLLLYYIYENAFKFWDTGMASTLTVVMLVMLLLIACVQFFGLDKKIHYN